MAGSKKRIKQDVMKTKEELIKIYSAYFPYNLDVLTPIWSIDEDEKTIQKLYSLTESYLRFEVEKNGFYNCLFEECKPVFYSMDMLTKEIDHKGERFIPIQELRRHCIDDLGAKDYDTDIGLDKLMKGWEVIYYPKLFIDKLSEWHFNIFGLSESEYIKKNL